MKKPETKENIMYDAILMKFQISKINHCWLKFRVVANGLT